MKAFLLFLLKLALTALCLWWAFSQVEFDHSVFTRPGAVDYRWLAGGAALGRALGAASGCALVVVPARPIAGCQPRTRDGTHDDRRTFQPRLRQRDRRRCRAHHPADAGSSREKARHRHGGDGGSSGGHGFPGAVVFHRFRGALRGARGTERVGQRRDPLRLVLSWRRAGVGGAHFRLRLAAGTPPDSWQRPLRTLADDEAHSGTL